MLSVLPRPQCFNHGAFVIMWEYYSYDFPIMVTLCKKIFLSLNTQVGILPIIHIIHECSVLFSGVRRIYISNLDIRGPLPVKNYHITLETSRLDGLQKLRMPTRSITASPRPNGFVQDSATEESRLPLTSSWWRHQMETFSELHVLCEGNLPVTDEFPSQRRKTRSVNVFFGLRLNKRLSIQSKRRWFATPSHSLWRHCSDGNKSSHFAVIVLKYFREQSLYSGTPT